VPNPGAVADDGELADVVRSPRVPRGHLHRDLSNAREHLHSLTRSLEFMRRTARTSGSPPTKGTPATATSTAAKPPSAPTPGKRQENEADREPGYFLNNAPRMRHRWFRSRGLFTSSGVVGAGGKAVPAAVYGSSNPAMHRTVNRADSILITYKSDVHPPAWNPVGGDRR
jgi:hypothetical protein